MMTLHIATGTWLVHFCVEATKTFGLRSGLRNLLQDFVEK